MPRRTSDVSGLPARPLPAPSPAAYLKVRPLAPGDAEAVADIVQRLLPDASHRRFARDESSVSWHEPEAPSGASRQAAFVARTRSGDPVAIGRYVGRPGDSSVADVAVAVAGEWRGRGVGGRLLRMLAIDAQGAGLDRLTATVARSNRPALRLLARHGFHPEAADDVSVDLARPLPRASRLR